MLAAGPIAFVVTLAACPAVILGLRRSQVLDRPGTRSSHDAPVPRGVGLAVAVGGISAAMLSSGLSEWRVPLILVSAAFGLLGLVEDLRGVSSLRRLFVQGMIAVAALPLLLRDLSGPAPWRLLFACGVLLWLVSYVNAFNFMDGINGIAAVQAAVAGAAWWAMGSAEGVTALEVGGAIVGGAAAGFAPFNFPRARGFLGDVGSYFLGAWLAVLVVIGLRAGLAPEAVVAPLAVALLDTLWTLVGRVRRGERWHEPHREHVYQRLVAAGWSHTATTLFVGGLLVAISGLGAMTLAVSAFSGRLVLDLIIAALLVGYLLSPRLAARGARRGTPAAH